MGRCENDEDPLDCITCWAFVDHPHCSATAVQGTLDTEPAVCYSSRGSNPQYARRPRYNSTAEYGNAAQSAGILRRVHRVNNHAASDTFRLSIVLCGLQIIGHLSTVSHCWTARAVFVVILDLNTHGDGCLKP